MLHDPKWFLDGRSEEDGIIRIHEGVGATVPCDVDQ
jgi:hypothetical protein